MEAAYQKPRYLTELEIQEITDVIPKVAAATSIVSRKVRQQIQYKLALQLRELELCPDAIEKFKGYIINQFIRSVISPGEPIGITTGEAIGQPITQMNLNSFHQTGSAKSMSMGIDAFRELFNASQHRKHENTTIHFKNKDLTFDEVLELRRSIVGISIGDLVSSSEIEKVFPDDRTPIPILERGWWYPMYLTTMDCEFVESRYYLRLRLNLNMLYTYKVTLDDIVKALDTSIISNNSTGSILRCIASPTSLGIIDVYPDERIIRKTLTDSLKDSHAKGGINDTNASLIFLQLFVVPYLSSTIIKGVPNISNLFPVSVTTWSVIRSEEPYMRKDQIESHLQELTNQGASDDEIATVKLHIRSAWNLWLDTIRMRITGIGIGKIRRLLELANISISHIPTDTDIGLIPPPNEIRNRIIVLMPEGWEDQVLQSRHSEDDKLRAAASVTSSKQSANSDQRKKYKPPVPGEYIDMLLKAQEKQSADWILAQKEAGVVYPISPEQDLHRAGTYVYAEVNGTNLKQLLAHPLVDARRTISNNPHEILRTFDAEATRNFIARDFYDMIIGNGSYVNPRYVNIIADFMTNMGIVVPITSRGISRQNRGVFADASFEHPVEFFIKAGMSGRWEEVASTSACIFMGKRALIGTGYMMLRLREDVLTALEDAASQAEAQTADVKIIKSDIDALGELVYANGDMSFDEGALAADFNGMFNTPDASGLLVPSATFQGKLTLKGGESTVLEIPDEILGIVQPLTTMLVPKGPVPIVQPTSLSAPPWILQLIKVEEETDDALPSLDGVTIASVFETTRQGFNMQEVTVLPIDVDLFLNS